MASSAEISVRFDMKKLIRTRWILASILLGILLLPMVVSDYTLERITLYMIWIPMTLGLAFMWGQGGVLSFGQTAFFGVAGYSYAIMAINWGAGTWVGCFVLFASLVITALFAWLVGYVIFYGSVKGVFVGIITLALTLSLEVFLNQTAGSQWTIGIARLNGYNGIASIPGLDIGVFQDWFEKEELLFAITAVCIVLIWFVLRLVAKSSFGNRLRASRDNYLKTEAMGHNTKKIQLSAFMLGSTLAGVSGILYVEWGNYITPGSMGLVAAASPVIWVCVGGRGSLMAAGLAAFSLSWLSEWLSVVAGQFAIVIMGLILIGAMALAPSGIFVGIFGMVSRFVGKRPWGNGGRVG